MDRRTRITILLASLVSIVSLCVAAAYESEEAPHSPFDEDLVIIRPPLNAGSGSGDFTNLDNAIDNSISTGSVAQLSVMCRDTCLTQREATSEWQNFPAGFEPVTLEVRWASSAASHSHLGGMPRPR